MSLQHDLGQLVYNDQDELVPEAYQYAIFGGVPPPAPDGSLETEMIVSKIIYWFLARGKMTLAREFASCYPADCFRLCVMPSVLPAGLLTILTYRFVTQQ